MDLRAQEDWCVHASCRTLTLILRLYLLTYLLAYLLTYLRTYLLTYLLDIENVFYDKRFSGGAAFIDFGNMMFSQVIGVGVRSGVRGQG